MTSLRLRFFLISWPLVVAAIAVVALTVDRFTVVELERVEAAAPAVPDSAHRQEWAREIAASWPSLSADSLRALVSSSGARVDLVVLGPAGTRLATTNDGIDAVAGHRPWETNLRKSIELDGRISIAEFSLAGIPIVDGSGTRIGTLAIVPGQPVRPMSIKNSEAWRSQLRRTLWTSAIVASLVAAAAAILLAGPLVRQIRRLKDASSAVGRGAFDVRIGATGRDELSQLARSFDAMAATLQNAEAHKRNLVVDVAHELRTPLTNIIGMLESIQDGLRVPDPAAIASLREEAALLASLVDELQELSLAESGQLAFHIDDVDAVAAARSAVDAVRGSAPGIELTAPAAAPAVLVRADARRLSQVLRNLLRNAATHTPAGGRITVEVVRSGSTATISIADSGRGIPPEHLPLIWERFHRVDPSRDRGSGGMGLGLALVRQLVVGMGGTVSVESEPGRGSRFSVDLTTALPQQ